jgi:drug/metabolite transporter (DMT)-like permease
MAQDTIGARSGEGAARGWLLVTVLAYGGAFVAAKPLVALLNPVLVSGVRYVGVALVLFAMMALRGERVGVPRAELGRLAAVGVLGFGLFQGLWGIALAFSSAANAAILMATAPMFGALFATLRGERVPRLAWLGLVVAFAGILLLINRGVTTLTIDLSHALGDLLWLGCAAIWALFTTVSRPLVARHGALKATAWAALFGSAFLMLAALPWALADDWSALRPAHLVNAIYLIAIAGALAQFAYYRGIGGLGVARAIAFMYLVPVFGVLAAVLVLGESFNAWQTAGAAAVIAGVALTQRR